MPVLRILLAPVAVLYGMALMVRHVLYDAGILLSIRPSVPTIAIGNLALGGTGKTPMLELVLRLLTGTTSLATLSRGYGRRGSDFHEVRPDDSAEHSGDEPVQVKRKFPHVRVFVGADRVAAIEGIQSALHDVRAVVLDDALQHRRLDAGLNILLTTWQRPWFMDMLLPAGRLRDLPWRRKAARIVVVTKCPSLPSTAEQLSWRKRLKLTTDQHLFFAGIDHDPVRIVNPGNSPSSILLFTGIADPQPLVDYLTMQARVEHIAFPDHHAFTMADLERLAVRFGTFAPGPKTLVTTEKDAARLGSLKGTPLESIPLAIVGIRAIILNEPERFAELIRTHVATHSAHR